MKICGNCKKEYKPSSRHKICPRCRSQLRFNKCQCGKKKQLVSIICAQCFKENSVGERSHNWKGGRITHTQGYPMIKRTNHPRATKTNNYIFEHILVMEAKLGRYLLPRENVHHLNGIRDDNRIDNLELWTKSPMAGIRATDAVKWAKEILNTYGTPKKVVKKKLSINTKIINDITPEIKSKGYLKKGYIMLPSHDGHPRKKTPNAKVFEHILVMENKLGRYLLPGENVHHLNGIKDDNRLENLELWTKPQPSGIRAEDAVKWATEILDRYENTSILK